MTFEMLKLIDIMGAINTWIETLTHVAALMQHEDNLKEEFCDIFEPMPCEPTAN